MNDRKEILARLFLWREGFDVHDGDLGSMILAKLLEPFLTELDHPVLVSYHDLGDLSPFHHLHQVQKILPLVG